MVAESRSLACCCIRSALKSREFIYCLSRISIYCSRAGAGCSIVAFCCLYDDCDTTRKKRRPQKEGYQLLLIILKRSLPH